MADAQDQSRLADKLVNAFTIDIFSAAQAALGERGITLKPFAENNTAPTYEEAKTLTKVKPYIPLIGIASIFLLWVFVRR